MKSTTIVSLSILVVTGCVGSVSPQTPAGTSQETIINPRAHVVDPSVAVRVTPDQLVFQAPIPADLRALAAGDVLVSAAGQGFLRGVVAADAQGDRLVVSTRP